MDGKALCGRVGLRNRGFRQIKHFLVLPGNLAVGRVSGSPQEGGAHPSARPALRQPHRSARGRGLWASGLEGTSICVGPDGGPGNASCPPIMMPEQRRSCHWGSCHGVHGSLLGTAAFGETLGGNHPLTGQRGRLPPATGQVEKETRATMGRKGPRSQKTCLSGQRSRGCELMKRAWKALKAVT